MQPGLASWLVQDGYSYRAAVFRCWDPGLIAAGGEDTVTYALPLVSRQGACYWPFPPG